MVLQGCVALALLAVVVCRTDVYKGRSNFESLQLCIWRALTGVNLKLWQFSLIWCACACYLIQLCANLATVCFMLWSWIILNDKCVDDSKVCGLLATNNLADVYPTYDYIQLILAF